MTEPLEYDVLLVYPFNRNAFFDAMIPLGLASNGAVLEEHGYRVKAIDFNTYRGDFVRDLRSWRPGIVGIIPKDFSWATYVPPKKQLLLLELDDVMILDQTELSLLTLILVGLRLNLQLTTISYHLLWGYIGNVLAGLAERLKRSIRGNDAAGED